MERLQTIEPTWNRDPRSRALTRGTLMALGRKRDWYFDVSPFWTIVWAILTLGTWPLLLQAFRFDRFRRLEWNQYHAYAQWLSMTTGDPIAKDLETFAERAAGKPSRRWAVRFLVTSALVVLALTFINARDGWSIVQTAFHPQSLLWTAILYSGILSVAWFVQVTSVVRQQALTALWIGRLSELLAAHDKRPIPQQTLRPPWVSLVAASAVALFGPTWAGVMFMAIAIQNRYTRSTRVIRLAMIERMLEWMDTSGLPVEFDIEEIEPDELLGMVA